jgi:hypothetical protein
MMTSNIFCLIYLIIGLFVSYLYTSYRYGKTINNKNNEGAMVNVFMMTIVVLWPLFLIKYIFSVIKYVRYKQSHKSKQ